MSRYTKTKDNLRLNYGFDHALGYWYDIIDTSIKDDEGNHPMIDEKSSFINKMNRGNFIEVLENFNVSEDQKMRIALDLPF
jgi:hypothetical protein